MKTKLLTFDKYKETTEQFEQRARDVVASLGEIVSVKTQATDSGDVVFQLDYTEKESYQDFYFIPWIDVKSAEQIINNSVSHVGELGKRVKHINLVILNKMSRACASIIVESDSHDGTNTIETPPPSQAQGQAGKQDQDANAEPDTGSKPKRKRKN